MLIESMMPSNHLILCLPFFLLPSIFPSIRVFSNESALHIRWPKYWNFSFSISPSNEYSGLISLRMDWWISLQSKGLSRVFSNTHHSNSIYQECTPVSGSVTQTKSLIHRERMYSNLLVSIRQSLLTFTLKKKENE